MSYLPMELPSGVFGAGMNGALGLLLGQGQQNQPRQSYPANPDSAGNIFGIHGKFGDILGKLGDALLIGAGADPIYAANKRRQAMAGAMTNYDPDNPMPNIQQMLGVDAPTALSLIKEWDVHRKSKAEEADKIADNDRKSIELSGKGRPIFGAMANTANAGNWALLKPQLDRVNKAYGLGNDIPDVYSDDWKSRMFNQGIDPKDKYTTDALIGDRGVKNRIAADRLGVEAAGVRARAAAIKAGVNDDTTDNIETNRHNKATEAKPGRGHSGGPSASVQAKAGGGAPAKFVGNKIRNKVTGQVMTWNGSKYE